MNTIRLIITGATGMVGEGVLLECLQSDNVEHVLSISRKPCGIEHPKLKELIHSDFNNLSSIQSDLTGYDACFFCAGVSSVGKDEATYRELTFTLTTNFARTLSEIDTDMTFCYISGAGTDSSEKGRIMWARVKGETENTLAGMPFKRVYNFRPAILEATKGAKNTLKYYKYFRWLIPIVKFIAPNYICSLKELATAMINTALEGYEKSVIEVSDIHLLQ